MISMDTDVGVRKAVYQAKIKAGQQKANGDFEGEYIDGQGSITEWPSDAWPACTSIIAGPPCPPFSRFGAGVAGRTTGHCPS